MSMRITFLGTSASVPTVERNLPAVALRRNGELILFDCGEGTQRQMIRAKIGFNRETKVLITHMHGDHILGLPGLIQTMSLYGRTRDLNVYGPPGVKAFLEAILETVRFKLVFKIRVHEVGEGTVCRGGGYTIHAAWAEHTVPTLAYALVEDLRPGRFNPEKAAAHGVPKGPLWSKLQRGQEVRLEDGRVVKPEDVLGPKRPGRKITYICDTRPSERLLRLAENSDVLIYEATFSDDLAERAREDMHSTAGEAALFAVKAGVRLLVLTHISARYSDPAILLQQARRVFPNVKVAEDLMTLDVPFRE